MGGIPRPIGNLPESSSQAMLVGCNVSREIGRITGQEDALPGHGDLRRGGGRQDRGSYNDVCVYIYIYR